MGEIPYGPKTFGEYILWYFGLDGTGVKEPDVLFSLGPVKVEPLKSPLGKVYSLEYRYRKKDRDV